MSFTDFGQSFGGVMSSLWFSVLYYVPAIILGVLLLALGWYVGQILEVAVKNILTKIKVNKIFEHTALPNALEKAGVSYDLAAFVGGLVRWFVFIVFAMFTANWLGMYGVTNAIQYLLAKPLLGIVSAVLILIATGFIARFVKKTILTSSYLVRAHTASMTANIAVVFVWMFGALSALDKVGIDSGLIEMLYIGIVVAATLALGLAFGLGGKEVAGKVLADWYDSRKK